MCSKPTSSASVCIWLRARLSSVSEVIIMRSPNRSLMAFMLWCGRWQCSIHSPALFAVNSTSCLRCPHQHRIRRSPRGLGLSPGFRTGYYKRVAVQVDGMMVHAKIDEPYAYATAEPHDQRRDHGTGNSVEGQPVPLHVGGVRYGVIRQHSPLLQRDPEVVIYGGSMRPRRMQNEQAQHAHHLLHG